MLNWLGSEQSAHERHLPQTLRSTIGAATDEAVNEIALEWMHLLVFETIRGCTIYTVQGGDVEPFNTSVFVSARLRSRFRRARAPHKHYTFETMRSCLKRAVGIDSDRALQQHAINILRYVVDAASEGKRILIFDEAQDQGYAIADERIPFPSVSDLLI